MVYLNTLREGMHVSDVYLCKTRILQLTKTGKEYESITLQDKTGTVDGKIWDPSSPGICDFDTPEYVAVEADVTLFNGSAQLNVKRIRKADEGEYYPSDYLPVSEKNIDEMYEELMNILGNVKNKDLSAVLKAFFKDDEKFIKEFKFSSAAKTVHHNFVGGLLEHTLSVVKLCEIMSKQYPIINKDLLITAASLHDVAKTKEILPYPTNDYSDEGQLLGHIVMGVEMIDEKLRNIPDYNVKLINELKHCILAHHGEYEYGSPKKPALVEAMALNLADNMDAKMETMKEILAAANEEKEWLGFNKIIDSNFRKTSI